MSGECISRDKILSYLNDIWLTVVPNDFMPNDDIPFAKARCQGIEDAMDVISEAPAADVVEVRHGSWLPSDIPDSILDKCSECGFDTGAFTFRYCPSCGAKMDLPEPPKEET